MTYFAYIAFMLLGTIMSGGVWLWTIISINPETSGATGILLFYTATFLTLVGVFALLGLLLRVVLFRSTEMKYFIVRTTFRQAVLLALMSEFVLALIKYGFLTWWSFGLLFLLIVSLEFFLSSGHHVTNHV